MEMSGAPGAHVARAFVVAEGAFGLAALKARIDALDGKVDAAVQTAMYTDVSEILRRLGLWFITNVPANADLASTIALYRAGVESLRGTFNTLVSAYEASDTEGNIKRLTDAGVPLDVAEDVAVLPLMSGAPEIAQLARNRSLSLDLVAGAYFAMGAIIGVDRLRGSRRASRRRSIGTAWRSAASSTISSPASAPSPPRRSKAPPRKAAAPTDRTRSRPGRRRAARRWSAPGASSTRWSAAAISPSPS